MRDKGLHALLSPVVTALGYELLLVERIKQGRNDSLLRLYIDKETGVVVDDCAIVSRQVSAVLDVEDPVSGNYTLEVSSPGVERPLVTREHFQQFVGQRAKVRLFSPIGLESRRNFSGLLEGFDQTNDTLQMEIDGEHYTLPFAQIEKANLLVTL
ncbi:ribosome maturation factor RimP [Candidatus Venteria ishoeyi]|uniref:Ribosome maturation factor RimP n=1 Tax=Candidatus Venteria ishoeyi TaxID=1899563 RepID=A0A1H6FAC7_9GAMM|nr:ribosome maturation factor RimP [Candidatus Venteria ishoeyi]MDM8547011.1 ribosome maturation factor RimP [Candidatus Venteria ishoeyi]SEH06573.1 Ribosome maturation factor RimP [Candidatus Venteria ishoeyi]